MNGYCEVEVTIKSASARSYKVVGSSNLYPSNHWASLNNDFFTIPRSQVLQIKDLGNNRQIMVLPKWLVEKDGLDRFIVDSRSSHGVAGKNMDESYQAEKLSLIDELDKWPDTVATLSIINKKEVFKLAKAMWIQRMLKENKLLVHPEIAEQLKNQEWVENDLQTKMIWASVLASASGDDSKQRFKTIKKRLLEKYGRDWWEDVYERKTNAYAARMRIKKYEDSTGPAVTMAINGSGFFKDMASLEVISALEMIPKK